MLTIICGEDSVSSRNYFNQVVDQQTSKGFDVAKINPSDITQTFLEKDQVLTLFGQQQIFITENLGKYVTRQSSKELLSILEKVEKSKNLQLIVWEDGVSTRELKIKKVGVVKEFKISSSIFKLLDSLYPKNFRDFFTQFREVSKSEDEMFVFIMILRHMRKLLLVSYGASLPAAQNWQLFKLKAQAGHWKESSLEAFYDGLYRIDRQLKTGKSAFGAGKSLELLACYFLAQ